MGDQISASQSKRRQDRVGCGRYGIAVKDEFQSIKVEKL